MRMHCPPICLRSSLCSLTTPDNDAVMGYDPTPRAPLDLPAYYRNTKDNSYVCKAHANKDCKQCCEYRVSVPVP
jgi:hypothetical protein